MPASPLSTTAPLRWILAALLAVAALAARPVRADATVAVVDLQRAISEVKEGVAANEKLKSAFSAKQAEIQKREQAIAGLQDEYQKQQMILSDEARKAKEQEILRAQAEYQQLYAQYQGEMQQLESRLVGEIVQKMQEIVAQIAGEKGYSVVLDAGTVVYSGGAPDITNELIKRYDAKYGG